MQASRGGSRFKDIVGGILTANLATGAVNLLTRSVKGFITEAAKVENAIADFKTLTGTVEGAKSVVDDLTKLGAATPLSLVTCQA